MLAVELGNVRSLHVLLGLWHETLKNETALESSWGLALWVVRRGVLSVQPLLQWKPQDCGKRLNLASHWRAGVAEEGPGKTFGDMHPLLQWRSQDSWGAMAVGWPPSTAESMEWRQPEPMRQVVCAVDGRAWKVEVPNSLGAQKTLSKYQMQETDL